MTKRLAVSTSLLLALVLVVGCQRTESSRTANLQDAPTTTTDPPTANGSSSIRSGTPCSTPSPDANRKVLITAPCDEAKVAARHFVEGIVTEANTEVSVVIHPIEVADYWVQPNVTVREGGRWRVLCYFGERGQHSGEGYEVIAFANPKQKLMEGQLLNNWPDAESKSQVIQFVRE